MIVFVPLIKAVVLRLFTELEFNKYFKKEKVFKKEFIWQ